MSATMARKRQRSRPAGDVSRRDVPAAGRGPSTGLILAALALVTVAAYTAVWRFDFIALDDPQYVTSNPNIAGGLSLQTIVWAFTTGREANWHPLTWMSHALDISLFGLQAGWHHAVNLLIHLSSTLLLFVVVRRMTGAVWRSAFVAAAFAVHPLHVESVAWVAERKDVLSALFCMLTLGAYVRYVERQTTARYVAVAVLLALGLMAKAMLVTLPLVLLLLDFWPLMRVRDEVLRVQGSEGPRVRRSFAALVLEKVPLLVIVAASSVATFLAQRHGGAVKSLTAIPVSMRAQNAVVSYVDYVRDAVWPANLGAFYPFPQTIAPARLAMAVAVLAIISAIVLRFARRAPYALVGWLWFLGMTFPVSGVVQAGGQARADRFMYLPLIGLTIAVAWSAHALVRGSNARKVLGMTAAAIILTWTIVTHAQAQHWRDTVALWSHTATVTDNVNNFGVHFSLAEYLRTNGRAQDAVAEYEKAIAKNPTYKDARFGLVQAWIALKQPERAIGTLQDLVAVAPNSVEARMSLGLMQADVQRPAEAVAQFTAVTQLQPDFADAHWRLGLALATSGRVVEALPALAEAVRLAPSSADMRNDYGWTLAQHNQRAAALVQLQEALRLEPKFVEAHHNIGRLLAAEQRVDEALGHFTEAIRLEPDYLPARISLGIALIRAGQVDNGVKQLQEVLRRDPQNEAARRTLSAIGR